MSYRLELTIPGLPKLPNQLRWKHWAVVRRHDQDWQAFTVAAVGRGRPNGPLQRARLMLVRHSAARPDPDALAASFKPIIDGLRHAGVLEDDTAQHVELDCRWESAPPRKGYVTVCVTLP